MAGPFMDPIGIWSELLFTLVVVIICFLIYIRTKENYDLTKHLGIKFFREAFLLLGLSYLVRFLFGISMYGDHSLNLFDLHGLFPYFLVITSYLSTIALIYLVFSSLWNRVKGKWLVAVSHGFAAALSVVAFITRSPEVMLLLQVFLLIVAVTASLVANKKHRFSKTKIVYVSLLIFWLISLWTLEPRRFLPHELRFAFQALSVLVFVFIYYRVAKWVK